jgi:LacI family transcriptional regulator
MPRSLRLPQVLLLIETSRAYGRGLVEGIVRYAEENGPWSIIFEERGLDAPLPRWLKHWTGHGIISRMPNRAKLNKLQAKGLPLVELYAAPQVGLPCVFPKEDSIACLAMEHFLDRGLRHFAFFGDKHIHWCKTRGQAFQECLRRRGYSSGIFDFSCDRSSAKPRRYPVDQCDVIAWIRSLPKPCGVLCASDYYATRLIQACLVCDVVVPEQLAILGIDNDPIFCGVSCPKLSSIDLNPSKIGRQAAALLSDIMKGRRPRQECISVEPAQVVTRESTDILTIDDADVAQAVRMIREQAGRQLRVSDIARDVGLSRRALEQRFQHALQRSPNEEILRTRMERAKTLLASTDMPLSLVAKRSGFSSQPYFTRAFHRRVGIVPNAYRRNNRKNITH